MSKTCFSPRVQEAISQVSHYQPEIFMVLIRPDMKRERLETQLTISKMHAPESAKASAPGGGGHLSIFWVGMCRPGL